MVPCASMHTTQGHLGGMSACQPVCTRDILCEQAFFRAFPHHLLESSSAGCGEADGGALFVGLGAHRPAAVHQRGAGHQRGDWYYALPGQ